MDVSGTGAQAKADDAKNGTSVRMDGERYRMGKKLCQSAKRSRSAILALT